MQHMLCFVLIEKMLCMCLVGLLWVLYYCTMYYMCALPIHVRDSTYREIEQTKIYIAPCIDCDYFYIDPVQRAKVNDYKVNS